MAANCNYGVDKIQRNKEVILSLKNYTVPVGMKSIIYLDYKPPSKRFLESMAHKKKDDEILIVAKWNYNKSSFVITSIIS